MYDHVRRKNDVRKIKIGIYKDLKSSKVNVIEIH